jgi:hypothetical protein
VSKEDLLFEAALEEMRQEEDSDEPRARLPYTEVEEEEVEVLEDLMSRPGWALFLHRLWEMQVQWNNIVLDPRRDPITTSYAKGVFQGLRMAEHVPDNMRVEGMGQTKEEPDLSSTQEHIPPRPGQRMTRRKKPTVSRRKRT